MNITEKQRRFIIRIIYYAIIIGLVYLAFTYAVPYLLPFIIAFILVSFVNPLVRKIEKYLPRQRSMVSLLLIALIYILAGTLLVIICWQLIIVIIQLVDLVRLDYLPNVIEPGVKQLWSSIITYIQNLPVEMQDWVYSARDKSLEQIQTFIVGSVPKQMLSSMFNSLFSSVPSLIVTLIFTVMLSFFIGIQYEKVLVFMRLQLPKRVVSILVDIRGIMGKTIAKYLLAVLTLMCITFIELSAGLYIIGVDQPLLIAAGISLLDALPVLGTGAAMIPWVIIKLIVGDYQTAASIAILYGVVTIVRNIIEPKIVGDKLGLNPIVSMIAIFFGYKAIGVFGMIFMPVVIQIILELHKKGSITLYKDPQRDERLALALASASTGATASTPNDDKAAEDDDANPNDEQGDPLHDDGKLHFSPPDDPHAAEPKDSKDNH